MHADTDTDTDTRQLHGDHHRAAAAHLSAELARARGGVADCPLCGATGLALVNGRLRAHPGARVPFAGAGACDGSGRRLADIPVQGERAAPATTERLPLLDDLARGGRRG